MATKLEGSYEFSELTQIEGIFVSNGKERATGRIIQIHLFPAAKAELANRICRQLLSLPEDAQRKILRYGQEGPASYFVTEPLPAGEYLQSWMERQTSRVEQQSGPPAVSPGLAEQLRQLGIAPSPLAPMMPGPEKRPGPENFPRSPGAGDRRQTPLVAPPQASSGSIPAAPGELTREFRSLYGERQEEAVFPSPVIHEEPAARPPAANEAPGLETWLNLEAPPAPRAAVPQVPPPEALPLPPPPLPAAQPGDLTRNFQSIYGHEQQDAGFPPAEFPETPQRALPDAVAPPASRVSFAPAAGYPPEQSRMQPVFQQSSGRVQPMPIAAPARTPPPPLAPRRDSTQPRRALDWKVVLLIAGALLALAAAVVAFVEISG